MYLKIIGTNRTTYCHKTVNIFLIYWFFKLISAECEIPVTLGEGGIGEGAPPRSREEH